MDAIMYYSRSTGSFYTTEIHGNSMPDDVVEITVDGWQALQHAESEDKRIEADADGRPVAVVPPPHVPTTAEVEAQRLRAYADPLTGSDRYFAEAAVMDAAGEPGADDRRALGLARRAEIQAEYPWPVGDHV